MSLRFGDIAENVIKPGKRDSFETIIGAGREGPVILSLTNVSRNLSVPCWYWYGVPYWQLQLEPQTLEKQIKTTDDSIRKQVFHTICRYHKQNERKSQPRRPTLPILPVEEKMYHMCLGKWLFIVLVNARNCCWNRRRVRLCTIAATNHETGGNSGGDNSGTLPLRLLGRLFLTRLS